MDFEEFKKMSNSILEECFNLNRMDCLNPFKAMDFLIKDINFDKKIEELSKENLLELWKEKNGLNYDFVITKGVRNSISILSKYFNNKHFIIPYDVYPKYVFLTEEIKSKEYYNLNDNGLTKIDGNHHKNSVLLLECPITPEGRLLNTNEINFLLNFLKEKTNVIIIDTVYAYETKIVFDLLKPLIETEQCYVLHSMSKTYLSPEVLGINYFPKKDYTLYYYINLNNDYLNTEKYISDLNRAYLILKEKPDLPLTQEKMFKEQFVINNENISNKIISNENSMGYFRKVKTTFIEEIKNDIMIVPNSIFNTKNPQVNGNDVITCLYYMSEYNLNKK